MVAVILRRVIAEPSPGILAAQPERGQEAPDRAAAFAGFAVILAGEFDLIIDCGWTRSGHVDRAEADFRGREKGSVLTIHNQQRKEADRIGTFKPFARLDVHCVQLFLIVSAYQ